MGAEKSKTAEFIKRVEAARDDLVSLTQELIRIHKLNPPGENYQKICEYLARRLSGRGFAVEMVRAYGTPGDSDKYPRWNILAPNPGGKARDSFPFNSHPDCGQRGTVRVTHPLRRDRAHGQTARL